MKTKLWAIPFALLLGGCDDMLTETPDDFLSPENFYQTASDAEAAIVSAYAPLVSTDLFKASLWRPLIISHDLGIVGPFEENASIRQLSTLAITSDNRYIDDIWGGFYDVISRANTVIDRVPDIEMDETRRAGIVGEAKFLRALAYFYMVRLWGDVPLITSEEEASPDIARTPAEQVYQQIIQDAQDAVQVLPLEAEAGRASQGAALTLLADVYLALGEWQSAVDAAQQVIDSGAYALVDDYLKPFLPAYENGPEHIFFLPANGVAPLNNVFVRFMYPRELGTNQGGGFASLRPTDLHYESYLPGDYRHDVTFFTEGCNIRRECVTFPPHIYKYRPTSPVPMNNGDEDWQIYRYAEVLLIYAEALNELGRSGEAVQYLNMIRARARNGTGDENLAEPADYTGPMDQATVREVIFQERTWELAYEGKRWFDLIRRGEAYFMEKMSRDPSATDLEPTDMLWPVPQAEIDLNPELEQNPGY